MQDIGDKDFGLIDKVSGLLSKKAKLLEELKAINNEAQEGQHQLRDGCFEKSFHVKYAKKVAEVSATAYRACAWFVSIQLAQLVLLLYR